MSRRRRKAKEILSSDPVKQQVNSESAEADEGFGIFRFQGKPWNAPKKASRKAQQLCQQVKDALHGALAACGDMAVQSATILKVEPAPHTGRLLVLLGAPADVGREVVAEAVVRAAGHLRAEVASAISRRYAPELVFEVIEM